MSNRRRFLTQVGRVAGAAGLSSLLDARRVFATDADRVFESLGADRTGARLAEEYLLAPDVAYLNHASIGTIPRAVHEARLRYLALCESNPWLYMWGGAWESTRESVRAKAAEVLHCSPGDLAITHNTTEGFNVLANGLPLRRQDEVLFSTLNHPGASVCWTHAAKARGYSVRQFTFPIHRVPQLTPEEVVDIHVSQISSRTRVLAFPHIDNMVGLRHPIRELSAAARARGVEFIAVDGAQSVGMIPVDLAGADVDFYSASPHKWLQAPKGLGLLFVAERVRELLSPMWVTWGQERWEGTGRIFEDYGTRNLPELIALGDAIDFQTRLGEAEKTRRYEAMWRRMREAVMESPGLIWHSPTTWDLSASLYSIEVRGMRSGDLFRRLDRESGMVFRAFETPDLNSSRISPNLATTEAQLEAFLQKASSGAG